MIAHLWNRSDALAIGVRLLLLPLSAIYWIGWKAYLAVYSLGLKRAKQPHRPIVVIGNFTVGGSGKTPIAIWIAQQLVRNGFEVVIGCSGYGSPHSKGANHAPDGPLNPFEWGDEPAEIREVLPAVPLVIGRARVSAAQLCHVHYPNAVLVMDDGLQHLPLQSDVRIAIDPTDDNRLVLPAGPYREPVDPKRADLIIPGHFQAVRTIGIWEPDGKEVQTEYLVGLKAQVLCAIGRHDEFLRNLGDLGLKVEKVVALGDHDPLSAGTLFDSFEPETPIIVTRKDWVKLRHRGDLSKWKLWIAKLEAHIEPEKEFSAWLIPRLMAKVAEKPNL